MRPIQYPTIGGWPYTIIPLLVLAGHEWSRWWSVWHTSREAASTVLLADWWPVFYFASAVVVTGAAVLVRWDGRVQLAALAAVMFTACLRGVAILEQFGHGALHVAMSQFALSILALWALVWVPPRRWRWRS